MQINSGFRALLAHPWIYKGVMRALRDPTVHAWFKDEILRPVVGQKIVDFGCGPATILHSLHGVNYVGLDISSAYVEAARAAFGDRGTFIDGHIDEWERHTALSDSDTFLFNGVLHHIDDAGSLRALRLANHCLKPGGRLIAYEPAYLMRQSRLVQRLMATDRGQHIRTEQAWKDLVSQVFPDHTSNVVTKVNRLGYTCIVIDAVA